MTANERTELVAPCGIDCGICELYVCGDDPSLMEAMVSRGMPRESLPCEGCMPSDGDCPVIPGRCVTHDCAADRGVRFCSACQDFPCPSLNPAADRADVLPHNLKVYNLLVLERRGIDGLLEESAAIKRRYYRGSMVIGAGPQVAEPAGDPPA